ncbi:unnamed protein product [Peronospora belbahrii]|uniref:Uncharacterized protein n=1 Tax=Peronospora belbahrii TaxID=622444 RepID=A0ABN8CTV6_9STRA|nr:unnamed protein product [Peronospora belbahrii]
MLDAIPQDGHNRALRSKVLLTLYRGYEITTTGDSFQLTFHTIQKAVSYYCPEVQLQLLAVKWPKELHGIIPSTKKQRVGHRIIFRGLRVRMGIHDAMGSDGHLLTLSQVKQSTLGLLRPLLAR